MEIYDEMWSNLIGQERARKILGASIIRSHIVHNYLLEGPLGVGKFPFAVAFARNLICSHRDSGKACGVCEDCHLFDIGHHPDALVMSREVDLSADEAREIRNLVMLSPQRANGKVIVLDSVDRMHPSAGNILLKTLEEAPGATTFILTTHRADKLLPTILSRSLRVPFFLVSTSRLKDEYERVLRVDSEKAGMASELSGGRPGWGIRFLLHPEFQSLYKYGREIISDVIVKMPLSAIFKKEEHIVKFMKTSNRIFSEREDIKGMDGGHLSKLFDGEKVDFRPINFLLEDEDKKKTTSSTTESAPKAPRHLEALGFVLLGGIFRGMISRGEVEGQPTRYVRLLESFLEAPRLLERYFNRELVLERFVLHAHGRFEP